MPPSPSNTASKTSAAPERSLVQRMEALQRANEIRTRRAQLKRDLRAGRASIHQLLTDSARLGRDGQGLRHAPRGPQVRPREGQQDPAAVPHLAVEDHRRPLGAPARRAREHAPAVVERRLRHHRPVGRRQGDADPGAARTRARAGAVDQRDHAPPAARRDPGRRLPLPLRRGVRCGASTPATSSSGPSTPGAATGRCATSSSSASSPGIPSCWRSSCRAPARCAGPCPRRSRSSSRRRRPRRCACASSGAAPITPRTSSAGSAWPREELAARSEFPHVVVNDRLEDAVDELESIVRSALGEPLPSEA